MLVALAASETPLRIPLGNRAHGIGLNTAFMENAVSKASLQ